MFLKMEVDVFQLHNGLKLTTHTRIYPLKNVLGGRAAVNTPVRNQIMKMKI